LYVEILFFLHKSRRGLGDRTYMLPAF